MTEPIYRQLADERLADIPRHRDPARPPTLLLPAVADPQEMRAVPPIPPRTDGWCENRAPGDAITDWDQTE